MEVENIEALICDEYQVDRAVLFSRKRDAKSSEVRHFVWLFVHNSGLMSYPAMSRRYRKARITIIQGVSKIKSNIRFLSSYSHKYAALQKKIKECDR